MTPLLRAVAIRKGVFGGSRAWTLVWVVLLGVRLFQRLGGRRDDVVFREALEPGQGLLITSVPPR